MSYRTKQLQGPCSHCGGSIQYPAQLIGTVTQCPHCHRPTELRLAAPPQEPLVPRKVVLWTLTALVVLLLGLAAALLALNQARKWAEHHKTKITQPARP